MWETKNNAGNNRIEKQENAKKTESFFKKALWLFGIFLFS